MPVIRRNFPAEKGIIMKIINGSYTSAVIYHTNNEKTGIEPYALAQIQALCDNEAFTGSQIRVMPDVHPGKVGTIGFTATVGSRILPQVVGIDIGCGITLARLSSKARKDCFPRLDTLIRERIPAGSRIRNDLHRFADSFRPEAFYCRRSIDEVKAVLSLGTLGGGNHFIELDEDENGALYAVIHSGSRSLGKMVTEYYMREGQKALRQKGVRVPYELTWLEGSLKEQYLLDLQLVQQFAALNRESILDELTRAMKWKTESILSCQHNYVDLRGNIPILRKGAISARKEEPVIIPIHMRDGVLLGKGLGNKDWNFSAPHGAGRIMKREDVKKRFTLSAFKKEMKGIYSPSISKDTLDESPFAYRPMDEIRAAVPDTVEIDQILHPVYNFKAGREG